MTKFTAVVTNWWTLWHFFTEIRCWRKLKARMHVFARLSIGTESSQVIFTQHTANVSMPTPRTMPAKSSVVPRTIFDLTLGVNVQESAFLLVTCIESRVEITFRHFRHVIFVQEFAAVALFTKCSKPMFTYYGLLLCFDVSERAKFLIALSLNCQKYISVNFENNFFYYYLPELKKLQTAERDLSMPAKGSGSAPICSLSSCSILK